MNSLDGGYQTPPVGSAQPRCAKCRRFARLLPGDTECARCSGVLALEFDAITTSSDATVRGAW